MRIVLDLSEKDMRHFRGVLRNVRKGANAQDEETVLSSRAMDRGLFDPPTVRRLVEEHVSRRWDHSYRLWSLLVLEMWQRTFLDPAAPPAECPAGV